MQTPNKQSHSNTIETVVKLYGNQSDNITTIISTLNLQQTQKNNVRKVLTILYSKIDKLRVQRNMLRDQLNEQEGELNLIRADKDKLEAQLTEIHRQLDNMENKPNNLQMAQYSFDQTPPMKQIYMSMQFGQNKQNKPLGLNQIKVSSFQSEHNDLSCQFQALMKRYNLTGSQFKKIMLLYAQEQRKALEQLETDSQRQLYIQSKRTGNYEDWLKRMSKKIVSGKYFSSISSNLSHK